jgi:hypothetical protein
MISFSLFTQSAFASLTPTSFSPQVPFFKSPESQFSSGYSTFETLQKQQVQKMMTAENVFQWNKKIFRPDEIRPVLPVHLSQFVFDVNKRERWKILESTIQSFKVENTLTKKVSEFQASELLSDPSDLGYALTLKDVYLKTSADQNSKILTTIPLGYKLKPIEFKNAFVQVQYKDYKGFVSLSETLTKFDLATMVYTDQKWQFIKKREYDFMITNDNERIQLNKIERVMTPDTRGIIASSTQKIPIWSQVEVVHGFKPSWIQSELKGHGKIWWKLPKVNSNENEEAFISIDQLIRQPISSISFHPKNASQAILSSNGVYITKEGLHWKKLSQFEHFNGPVHYFNDLLIFVGHYRSVDGGKTFENYIQIDKLAQAIEDQYGFLPKKLQVNKIETKAPYRIKIEIDTGTRKIKMETPLFAQDWKAVKGS